jgi:uncharacterized protein (TIGR00661 family)
MKILFGIQSTGNGHISRSTEIYNLLKQHPGVERLDVVISGGKAQMQLPFEVNYQYKGFSFYYGKKGKISIFKSIGKANFFSFAYGLWQIPFKEYDLVISDFEPICLWGAKIAGVKSIGIGNMYSMTSKLFPGSGSSNTVKFVTKVMCPAKQKIGMHFQRFDDFVYYPVIRHEIRDCVPADKDFNLVYLTSYSDEELIKVFCQPLFLSQKFVVYSKTATKPYVIGNTIVKPINHKNFTEDIINCKGVITTGGFQTISEALYLGKKLFVIPIKKQFEQLANARVLAQMGVATAKDLDVPAIAQWVNNSANVHIPFEDDLGKIVDAILSVAAGKVLPGSRYKKVA